MCCYSLTFSTEERNMKVIIDFSKAWGKSAKWARKKRVKDDRNNIFWCYEKVTVRQGINLAFGWKWGKKWNQREDWGQRRKNIVLLNLGSWTWVHSPMHHKANLLTWGCGEGKHSIYCRHQTSSPWQLGLKNPWTLW